MALAAMALAAACRDDAPVAPPQASGVNPVVKVVVAAPSLVLEPGDSVRVSAQAFDAQGMVLPTVAITWSSSATSVASVDARGMVRAVAVGTAQITATAEGQSGSVDFSVSVTQLCACTKIIDSTAVELIQRNDSSGVFVFRLISGQAPVIDSGSIIVGAEDGGFLRRVHRVVRADNLITLQTTPAHLEEAIRTGGFASTSFSEGESIPIDGEDARWGPWTATYLAPNVKLAGAKCCSLDDITFHILEIDAGVTVTGEVGIKKGNISFEPRLELSGEISDFRVQRFRMLLGGAVDLNIDEYELKVGIEVEGDKKLWTNVPKKKRRMARLVKPFSFFIGPVPVVGIINKTVSLEVTLGGSASTVFTGLFRTGFGVSAGAEWVRNRGWRPITGSTSYFDLPAPTFKGLEGEASLKIALVPEYSILFYGVGGPFINLEPYAEGTATATATGPFNGLVPSGFDWELKADVGLNVNIGAKLSVFGVADLLESSFEIPIIRPFTLVREFSKGPLTARTTVTGPDQPDSIKIRLRPTFADEWTLGPLGVITRSGPPPFGRSLATSSQDATIAPNDSVTFQRVRSGTSFMHRAALRDVAGNCAADTTSFDVGVRSGSYLTLFNKDPSSATFTINCIPMGALKVRTVVTGQDPVARSRMTLTRLDTVGSGKGTPPLVLSIPGGPAPADTITDRLAPANPANGAKGSYTAALDPGRRNCAVAKPTTHGSIITSGDTAYTEFRLTCVALGAIDILTQTQDPDAAPPSDPVTFQPNVAARDAVDNVFAQPSLIGASASSVARGLVPLYNASGASGGHIVTLAGGPNRCTLVGPATRAVTVFPGDTAIAPFSLRCVERLHVTTRSTGPANDRDGYIVVVDYGDGSADSAAVSVNQTIGIAGVRPGMQTIRLADVDPNCIAPASVNRQISGRDSTLVSFSVHCPGPAAPTGLRTTQILSNQVDLAWDAPPVGRTVAHYRLYRTIANLPGVVVIDSIGTLTHSDAGLTPFTQYLYQVAAVDINGVVGPRSAVLAVRTLDGTGPTAPGNLVAVAASASRINLTWTAASDPQSGVNRYRIYRGGALIDSTSSTSHADAGLTASTTYAYQVVAVNGQGFSGLPSNTASATTLDGSPPTAPSGLSATPVSSTQIDLAWTAATDPQSGIASYRVYRGATLIGTSTAINFTDGGLTPATSYTYEVSAVNGAGVEGPRAGPVTATTHAPALGDVTVNVVSLGTGIPAAGYQVQLSASGVLLTQPIGSSGSVSFTGLVAQTYTVTLQNLPANCVVDDGPNPRSVVVIGSSTVSTTFRVRCS